jgi:hypothetical protein
MVINVFARLALVLSGWRGNGSLQGTDGFE